MIISDSHTRARTRAHTYFFVAGDAMKMRLSQIVSEFLMFFLLVDRQKANAFAVEVFLVGAREIMTRQWMHEFDQVLKK